MPSILIIEDEPIVAAGIAGALKDLGYEVVRTVTKGEEAVRAAEETKPDLILMDIKLAGEMDGIQAAEQIRSRMDIPVVYLTAYAEKDVLERAKKTGPYGFLSKPVGLSELCSTIEIAFYRHRADKRLRDGEKLSRALVETTGTGYVIVDEEGRVLEANAEYLRLSAHTSLDEIRGRSVTEWTAEHDRDRNADAVRKCFHHGFVRNLEIDYVDKNGTITPTEINATVVKMSGVTCIVAQCRETTERKQVEVALRESEDRFRSLIEQAADAIFVHDFGGKILEVNQQACASLGYTRKELLSMSVSDVDPDSIPRRDSRKFWRNLPATFESRLRRKDGATFPVEVRLGSIEYGNTRVVLGVARDLTDRKKAEERLRESEKKYRRLHETMRDAFVIVDMTGRIQDTNQAYQEMLGYSGQELRRLTYRDLTPREWHAFESRIVEEQILVRGYSDVYQKEYRRKDGTIFPVELRTSLVRDKSGRPYAMWAIVRDITEQRRAQKQLLEAKSEAERANRAKSEFLANMSHELRTPLNSIIGFAEILEDQLFGPLNETQSSHVRHIVESGHHLLQLVGDILDLSKIESREMRLDLSHVSVRDMLESSLSLMRDQALNQDTPMELRVAPEINEMTVLADEVRLRQVMFNLLSNAVKFTPETGNIRVEARTVDRELIISVCDTGIGINESDTSLIFKAFQQAHSTLARQREGTGLGLSLARNLVELHGGRIWVESDGPGKGSTFSFAIPLTGDT